MPAHAAKTKATSPDLETWLTREQAADLLGVAHNTVIRFEQKGMLTPQYRMGVRGHMVTVYDPRELAACPVRKRRNAPAADDPDEVAARAFELFDAGASNREIVVRVRKQLETVEKLREEWKDAGGADITINDRARAELFPYVGSFSTVPELCARIRELFTKRTEPAMQTEPTPTEPDMMTIEAMVPDNASDKDIERAILAVLDQESTSTPTDTKSKGQNADD